MKCESTKKKSQTFSLYNHKNICIFVIFILIFFKEIAHKVTAQTKPEKKDVPSRAFFIHTTC